MGEDRRLEIMIIIIKKETLANACSKLCRFYSQRVQEGKKKIF